MYKNNNVLVSGGTGFVGSNFVLELLNRGAKVLVPVHNRPLSVWDDSVWDFVDLIQADLTYKEDCLHAMKGIDYVVHAAGAVTAAQVTTTNPMDAIATNLILTLRIIQAAWESGVERFLVLSSHTTYPNADYPIKESEMWSGDTAEPYFGYGWMRRYLERLGEFVASKSDMKIAIVRPTAAYGQYDNFDPATSHVIPALIRKALEKQDPYEVWGSGDEVRDFINVKDMVRGGLLMLENHAVCDPVNLGSGQAVTIRDVVDIILRLTDHHPKVVYNNDRPTTIPIRIVDTSKAKELGFEAEISIEQGLQDTIEWYRRNR
ncbi:hypothetical protein LCGC14_1669280 [marine sediment metagenome]|uniref:NAD-dependent epimerase/dehydratase domain-containing protein n=1 Tax=marine sediment metagenome TaxID=412755 RepID=A0A0F9KRU6_9ZZZZ